LRDFFFDGEPVQDWGRIRLYRSVRPSAENTRVWRLLRRRGLGAEDNPDGYDELAHNQPLLSELYGASIAGRICSGRGAGRRITRVGDEIDYADLADAIPPGCACVSGFSVHAGVAIPAHDRMRLEDLQPDYNQVGTDRMALNHDFARGASMARRKRSSVAELRRQSGFGGT
jgi:hypothetical protein